MSASILDTRGLMCPEPVNRAAAAVEKLSAGAEMLVLATDPVAPIDFEVWCQHAGLRYLGCKDSGDWLEIRIQKKPAKFPV